MSKLYLIHAETLPVYFDGAKKDETFIADRLLIGDILFPIRSGDRKPFGFGCVEDNDRPGVYQPDWVGPAFKETMDSRDGWRMVLRSNGKGNRLFVVNWRESNTNSWLERFLPNCLVKDDSDEITLQILFDTQVQEMRLDWTLKPGQTFSMLGLDVELQSKVTLSAVLQRGKADRLNRIALLLLDGQKLTLKGDFAWTRDELREVMQFDPDKAENIEKKVPAYSLVLTPMEDTLVLADIDPDGQDTPPFLKKCKDTIVPLDFSMIERTGNGFTWPSKFDFSSIQSLDISKWNPRFALSEEFAFPFLYSDGNGSGGLDKIAQCIEVSKPDSGTDWRPDSPQFSLPVSTKINLGTFSFDSEIPFEFDVTRFAVRVDDHKKGIAIKAPEKKLEKFLGLDWTFKPNQDGVLFILVTEAYNYQLRMAKDAELIVEFSQMSADPIRFRVSNFAVSGKGITLTAEVTDDPARLNGINTLFRFSGSRLEIVDNVIQDLTLRGSGPLPPDLVGEAIVDLSLQFGRDEGGNFELRSGGAKLQGSQLLSCKATRFQFSVDAIGLQFVNDGGYHLYFTLTGSAQFIPAPADGKDHALAFLPGIKLDLVDCPLTSDISVLAKHISLLIEFPKPKKFRLLGAYEMELRAIGFIPSFDPFDGDAAMQVTGQIMFADGKGDAKDAKPDYHSLYIGLPEPGSFLPRLYCKDLPLNLNLGTAIKLNGEVGFVDDPTEKGFWGQGTLEIQGLPPISATFAFMRVRRNEDAPWERAWFVYVNASKLSLPLPLLKLYIREIGLGFGYRYTLVSIQATDEEQNLKDLLYKLRTLSRTQGELAKRDSWAVDLEKEGQDPRWTIVLRAMMAQNSASKSPLVYKESQEKNLSNLYLLDVVAAFRSDLTFYMAARGWLNTNYNDYLESRDDIGQRPVVSGFILYSTRRKRFLAHVASNPGGYIGTHPALPPPLKKAIQNAQVSATLLMEPGLAHFELGWPNMLRWKEDYGPLTAEYRGGLIFRVTPDELVLGVSFLAQAHLRFEGGISLKIIGVTVRAEADVQYGGRLIGVVGLGSNDTAFMVYAALGIEVRCKITIEVWIDLFFWSDRWALSLTLNFTAGVELGIIETSLGVRGRATLGIEVAGHNLQVGVSFKANERVVDQVYSRTQQYLTMGLEATDVESVPGIAAGTTAQQELLAKQSAARALGVTGETGGATERSLAGELEATGDELGVEDTEQAVDAAKKTDTAHEFHIPNYNVFVVDAEGKANGAEDSGGWFVLIPQGQRKEDDGFRPEQGFLPPAPMKDGKFDYEMPIEEYVGDFTLQLPESNATLPAGEPSFQLEHWNPEKQVWEKVDGSCSWKANWEAVIVPGAQRHDGPGNGSGTGKDGSLKLAEYLRGAFITDELGVPVGDPDSLGEEQPPLADERVQNPSDAAFEAAVRGAVEQFRGSPFFKRDPEVEYDRILTEAFKPDTSIYAKPSGNGSGDSESQQADAESQQRAYQMRGLIIQKLIGDVQEYARNPKSFEQQRIGNSVPFQMGLVFRFRGKEPDWPDWLTDYRADKEKPWIFQRKGPGCELADENSHVRTFTIRDARFDTNPPRFQKVCHYTDANTIAITWELAWSHPLKNVPPESRQADPEHHLLHYEVRRRPLGGGEREVVYTVKSAQVLHRENGNKGDVLKRLKPRFQVVDHFGRATEQQAAALPVGGRTYLYTITPKDLAGNRGRPLTLVATRYPNDPPAVPVDGQLTVKYRIPQRLPARLVTDPGAPSLLKPNQIRVEWSEPRQQGSDVPVEEYRLVFRRDATLPIGSYGLDSDTQRSRKASLPTGSARPLPTDIKFRLKSESIKREEDGRRWILLKWKDLKEAGVVHPAEPPQWRPESWQVFFQTVSVNDVPSALAPVNLLLEIQGKGAEPKTIRLRPAGLEWLPGQPTVLPMLPPEDQKARSGVAHVPMPEQWSFCGSLENVSFQEHPAGLRLLQFRWNQGPSPSAEADKDYPLDLVGGYDLLELDIDAHTKETFEPKHYTGVRLKDLLAEAKAADVPSITLVGRDGDTAEVVVADLDEQSILAIGEGGVLDAVIPGQDRGAWVRDTFSMETGAGGTEAEAKAQPTSPRPADAILVANGVPFTLAQLQALEQVDVEDKDPLAQALRPIAEVQMLPGDERPFAPDNTLNTNQWEAWYPSQVLRRRAADRALKDAKSAGAWYSWRDSLLIWPEWPGLTDGDGVRGAALHPSLQAILDQLKKAGYHVDAQLAPPLQPGTLLDLMEATAKNNDPYGWAVLQHLGLSVAFSLRDAQTGSPVISERLLAAVHDAVNPATKDKDGDSSQLDKRHLHVELLFQPGKCIAPDTGKVEPNALLATVQLSLRPAIHKVYQYGQIMLSGTGSQAVEVKITPTDHPRLVINQSDSSRTAAQLEPGTETISRILLPSSGQTNLLLRSRSLPQTVTATTLDKEGNQCHQVQLDEQIEPDSDTPIRSFSLLSPDDPLTLYFPLPESLAEEFANELSEYHTQWLRFKRYVEALNSSDPSAPKISVPTAALSADGDAKEVFTSFLQWSQRFFDYSGDPKVTPENGAYVATAYPRTVSPALVSPDQSGRLSYDHLLADQWAHTYRYYIRPYGRYEKLWRSINQALWPEQAQKVSTDWLDTSSGGLDVVLERTRPVATPVVLSSSRLDVPDPPGSPALPGKWWEVIVARHPEQALIERNQTLARQLAFRQVAFSLLRRFGYSKYLDKLPGYLPGYTKPKPVESLKGAIPGAYPDEPDHLSLECAEPEDKITVLDLPARIGAFQQGAIALQWEALPFYYEHRLLLIAQTDSTVSAVNEVTQRAFEYVTPTPCATAVGVEGGVEVRIQLKRFWDSLPDAAQKQWAGEDPSDGQPKFSAMPDPKFSALPDPDVIYQLIEIYSGNVEAQADIYFDMQAGKFDYRQIGRRFKVSEPGSPTEPTKAGGFYELPVTVQAIPETEPLSREPISQQAIEKLKAAGKLVRIRDVDECTLVWYGTLSEDQKPNLMSLSGDVGFRQALKRLAAAAVKDTQGSRDEDQHRVTYETAPRGLDQVPSSLDPKIDVEVAKDGKVYTGFTWAGIMTDDDAAELRRWAQIPAFETAVVQAISDLDTRELSESMTPPRPTQDDVRDVIKEQLTIDPDKLSWTGRLRDQDQIVALEALAPPALEDDGSFWTTISQIVAQLQAQTARAYMDHAVTAEDNVPTRPSDKLDYPKDAVKYRDLTWTGAMSDQEERELRSWAEDISPPTLKKAFTAAIDQLVGQLERDIPPQQLTPRPLRPKQGELDDAFGKQLTIEPDKLSWTGRIREPEQLGDLSDLAAKGDASFQKAVDAIVERLTNERVTQPFKLTIPLRPTMASLPEGVKENLLIGTAALEYKGVMPVEEAQDCIRKLSQPADKKALEQLYRQAVRRGLHNNGLKIATRRGSARVSEMIPIPIQDLAVDGPAVEKGSSRPVRGGQKPRPT